MATMTPDYLSSLALSLGYKPYNTGDERFDTYWNDNAQAQATAYMSGRPQQRLMQVGMLEGGVPDYQYENLLPQLTRREQMSAQEYLRGLMGGKQQEDPYAVGTKYRLPYDPAQLYNRDVAALGQQPGNPLLIGSPYGA